MVFCLYGYLCAVCMSGARGGQKRDFDPWELELRWF